MFMSKKDRERHDRILIGYAKIEWGIMALNNRLDRVNRLMDQRESEERGDFSHLKPRKWGVKVLGAVG